jgi:hypothetical protein
VGNEEKKMRRMERSNVDELQDEPSAGGNT